MLAPHAVYCMSKALAESGAAFAYSDEALFEKTPEHPRVGHFKPDYAPEYLMAVNYICHLAVFKKSLFDAVGGERPACDGAQDHDLFLRLIDEMQRRDPAAKPLHIPQVLYYWRVHAASTSGGTAAKPYVEKAAQKAVADHLAATGRQGRVEPGKFPGTCHVVWDIPEPQPLVSILIPNKDHTDDLEKCLHSIYAKTTYEDFEVIVIENNSTDPATAAYYKNLPERYDRARVVTYKGGFNFSRINNFGRRYAAGKYLLLLNNDVEVINGDWLTQMVGECSQPASASAGQCSTIPTTRSSTPASSRAGRLRRAQPQVPQARRQRVYVPAGHGAGFLRRDSGLACWCAPPFTTSCTAWMRSSRLPTTMWTSACVCATRAGALSGRPTPSSTTTKASPAAPTRTIPPKKHALTPSMNVSTPCTGGRIFCTTPITARRCRWIMRISARAGICGI